MDWTRLASSMQRALLRSALAEPVTFTRTYDVAEPPDSTPPPVIAEVRGIYQRPPIESSDGGVDYSGAEHRVTVRTSDLPAWADRTASGSTVTVSVRGVSLRIVNAYPDGQGLTSLECRR